MRLASLFAALALGLAACAPSQETANSPQQPVQIPEMYQGRVDTGPEGEPIQIPAVRAAYLNDRNMRQLVPYNGTEAPGAIVVDPYARVLYHVQPGGQAMRYGVAVGRAGLTFEGRATIARKASWPSWRPTDNMLRSEPQLYGQFAGGLPGGTQNPLGSRALYLYQGSVDTYYRIHGTLDPSSIGKATSAGCIRMFNQDVMDLFEQIPTGTEVVVRSAEESLRLEGPMTETPEGYVVPATPTVEVADPALAMAAPATVQAMPQAAIQTTTLPATLPASQPVTLPVSQPVMDPYAAMSAAPAASPVQPTVVSDPFASPETPFVSPVESAVPAR
ncbi:L,D-transpeptidase [Paracoccus liaowanqingii]|uniref:L,D-transpeptidase n=1 Tax=Paracoccus liaowanqingii TaxID=2560053 RepID=A0A4Z1BIE7_9RHOB|nr:L,D-transpeptidase [Paracoccus liaowanqingii]TGN52281.1 L,D-transpeptidase [Paracoccus liaowanqingii]